jgi:Sel1 repeat
MEGALDNFIFRPAALNVSRPTEAMITGMNELEPLLAQYDPGMILVGPLLSLSMSSSYRYFYLAGNGDKVCETVALGFVEDESNAQSQRADFVEELKSRFEEVVTFGSHLEMARAVHTHWPNKETEKFLALAEREVMSKPAAAGQQKNIDDDESYAGVMPSTEPVDSDKGIADNLTHFPSGARDEGQPMPVLRPAQTLVPSIVPNAALSQSLRGDRAVTVQQRHTGLSQDDVALAIMRLKPPAELGDVPALPVEGARSLASMMLRFCAIGGSVALVAALVAWAMLRPSAWQVAEHAAPARVPAPWVSVGRNQDPSQAEAALPPSDPSHVTEANEPGLQAEPPAATVPPLPPSEPSQVASVQTGAAPASELPSPPSEPQAASVQAGAAPASELPSPPSEPQAASVQAGAAAISRPHSPPMQGGSAATHLDAGEIASLVNRGTDSLKSGDVSSARLLLRRAAEAGSASAALMLGTTYDPLALQQLGAIGVVPDVAQARQWYEKAAELGSDAASQRLANLAQTSP